jgi:hypothetical protein
MRIGIGSVKGSPGATTFALAMTMCWPRAAVLVEADPAGGDLGGRFGVPDVPGLCGLVVQARNDATPGLWTACAQRLSIGADVVVAPASGRQALAAVASLVDLLPGSSDVDLLFDVGRWYPGSPGWLLASGVDALLVMSGSGDEAVDHTAGFTRGHPGRGSMSVVMVGQPRFNVQEVSEAFGVPVVAIAPIDRRGAAVLAGSARGMPGWTRVGLAAAARSVALSVRGHPTPTGGAVPEAPPAPVLVSDGVR